METATPSSSVSEMAGASTEGEKTDSTCTDCLDDSLVPGTSSEEVVLEVPLASPLEPLPTEEELAEVQEELGEVEEEEVEVNDEDWLTTEAGVSEDVVQRDSEINCVDDQHLDPSNSASEEGHSLDSKILLPVSIYFSKSIF